MKSFFKILSVALLLCTFAASCGSDSTEPEPAPTPSVPKPDDKDDKIVISENTDLSPTISQDGESKTVRFTAKKPWQASVDDTRAAADWLHVSPASGEAGEAELTITAERNETPDDRAGYVKIVSGNSSVTISVTQKQRDALTISPSQKAIEARETEFEIEVRANIQFEVEVKADWIEQISTRAMSTTVLKFKAERNNGNERTGTIVIRSGDKSETITITQKGNQPRNVIYYTSTDNGKVLPSTKSTAYGPGFTIVSNTYLNGQGVITFDGDITQINGAFKNVANLKTISLPEGITLIGKMAFYYCENLEAIIIPPKVVEIGAESFSGCKKIQSISIPGSVTAIGDNAFNCCSGLSGITIPEGVISIGDGAFSYCSSLSEVTFRGNALTSIGVRCFSSCTALDRLIIPRNVKTFGAGCFSEMTGEVSLYVQDNSSIDGTFGYFKGHFNLPADNGECNKLKSICMSDYRKDMFFSGPYASEDGRCLIVNNTLYCANLCHYSKDDYTFPQGIKKVEQSAVLHEGIPNMPSGIIFPEGVEEIVARVIEKDDDAGYNSGRYAVRLPSTLKRMSAGVYETDNGVRKVTDFALMLTHWNIYFDAEVPPVNEMTFPSTIVDYIPPYEFYVREEFVDAYKAAWPHLAGDIKAWK